MSTRRPEPDDSGATREDTLGREIHLDQDRDANTTPRTSSTHDTHIVPTTDHRRDDDDFRRDDHDLRRDDRVVERHEVRETNDHTVDRARGGFSFWSVLSGMLVAFGAFIVLSAIIGAVLASSGVADGGVSANELGDAAIGAAIGVVIAQFLAYLWGGYTAGRMARGSGLLNGIMVPIFALLLVLIIGGIVAAVSGTAPDAALTEAQSQARTLPLPLSNLSELGTGAGIGLLIAMLLGGALGGSLGQRWHRKLEDGRTRYTDGDARATS